MSLLVDASPVFRHKPEPQSLPSRPARPQQQCHGKPDGLLPLHHDQTGRDRRLLSGPPFDGADPRQQELNWYWAEARNGVRDAYRQSAVHMSLGRD